jgi:nucleoside-diphosphate-sugar epimerase
MLGTRAIITSLVISAFAMIYVLQPTTTVGIIRSERVQPQLSVKFSQSRSTFDRNSVVVNEVQPGGKRDHTEGESKPQQLQHDDAAGSTVDTKQFSAVALPSPTTTTPRPADEGQQHQQKKKLILVGVAGYVGSSLLQQLSELHHIVAAYDRNSRAVHFPAVTKGQANNIPDHVLHRADAVVYLGGFTSSAVCDRNPWEMVMQENVHDVVTFAKRMLASQTLFFASTSAIGEGYGSSIFSEEDTPKTDVFDDYTRSMHMRELAMNDLVKKKQKGGRSKLPKLVAMRFGTIIGISPSQRVEFDHLALARNALLEGRITVRHPETSKSYLALRDLGAALDTMLKQTSLLSSAQLNVFHLASFSSSVGKATTEIASVVGVPVSYIDHEGPKDRMGFTLSVEKFKRTFHPFQFRVTEHDVIKEILRDADHLKLAREILDRPRLADHDHSQGPRCRVCGSIDLHEVLDLGEQPLANDFQRTAEEAVKCSRYPLRLDRCRKCHHAQLSVSVDRKRLVSNFSYHHSGTSQALDSLDFRWLAERVDKDVRQARFNTPLDRPLNVLALACNDGTQLHHFKQLGWYGVDPATNVVIHTRENRHTVTTSRGAAPSHHRFSELPETVDAIVAQNVLAHVPDPNAFLASIVAKMHNTTMVYVQTSQCEMFHHGMFDTVYHEHMSFFSPSSFRFMTERQGLRIVKYEITPEIHGGSCLVTLVKASSSSSASFRVPKSDTSLEKALALDKQRGIMSDVFYVDYRARVQAIRRWTISTLESAAGQGIRIVGYGATAKAMVLLLYTLSSLKPRVNITTFDYVVDDAPVKQNTFCPGTRIPIKPPLELGMQSCDRDLLITVLTWSFWDEIRGRITSVMKENAERCGRSAVWVILPFPVQRLISLNLRTGEETVVLVNPFQPPKVPLLTLAAAPEDRRKVVLVTHFFNEAFLLPHFIRHHAPMFDRAILIDSGSTDKSVEIIMQLAPSSWEVVRSKDPDMFHYERIDDEVVEWENKFPGWWKISLTITEFFVHSDLRGYLNMLPPAPTGNASQVLRIFAVGIVGKDDIPLKRFSQLILQRNEYYFDHNRTRKKHPEVEDMASYIIHYSRFIHTIGAEYPERYNVGRHSMRNSAKHRIRNKKIRPLREGFIAKFVFSPWPEIKQRKLQIGPRIPKEHMDAKKGIQHNMTDSDLNERRDAYRSIGLKSLNEMYAGCVNKLSIALHSMWYKTTNGDVVLRSDCGIRP